ncbi:MAG: flavin-dependent dehydrogenase [Myxococcota bacterium]
MSTQVDVIVAGGGPSGLAAALHAAQNGLSVVVIEPKPGVIDKACGEGLMPAAVRALEALDVHPETSFPFAGICYRDNGQSADGAFAGGPGLGVRRTVLHTALREAAERAGVQRVEGRVTDIVQTESTVTAAGHTGRYLIAADGLSSGIRAKLGLNLPSKRPNRLGLRRHYTMAPWSDRVEVFWSERAEAYVTPVADDLIGVAVLFDGDPIPPGKGAEAKYNTLLAEFPDLLERLTGKASTVVRGAGPFERRVRTRQVGRVLLVGDAAGYLDPITGEGIRMGLATAELAVQHIVRGDIQHYDRAWRRETRAYWWMTGGLLWARDRPLLRRQMVPLLRRMPWLFSRIVGVLGG